MINVSKAGALLLGAALAAGLAGCKNRTDDTPAPVTAPETTAPTPPAAAPEPAPVTPTTPPSDSTTPPPDTTTPPATGTTPGSSGGSGTSGTVGSGQPPSTAPDRTDHRDPQRERRPTY